MTAAEWTRYAEARLHAAGIEGARTEATVLAMHILRVDRAWLIAHPQHEFPELAGEPLLQRRESHEPLAYILGRREFFGREFAVRPGVLIPRHETETLVESTLEHLPSAARVLDLGTGSGCIGITIKLQRLDVEMTLSDVSPIALGIASENAEALDADVRLVLSDGFSALLGEDFDRIVSNPPYIGLAESLMPEVRDHEPHGALFSGQTGLEFYERLAREAADYLADDGTLAMEVGYAQAAAVRGLFEQHGWRHVRTVKDLSGTDRVVEVDYPRACRV